MLRFTDHVFVKRLVCSWVPPFVWFYCHLPRVTVTCLQAWRSKSASGPLPFSFSSSLSLCICSVYLCLYVCLFVCLCTVSCPLSYWKNHCLKKKKTFSHQSKGIRGNQTCNIDIIWKFCVAKKKSNCCVKCCIKLDGFCKSLHKIGFICLELGSVAGDTSEHSW